MSCSEAVEAQRVDAANRNLNQQTILYTLRRPFSRSLQAGCNFPPVIDVIYVLHSTI